MSSHPLLTRTWSLPGVMLEFTRILGRSATIQNSKQGQADSKAQCETAQSLVTPADAGVAYVLGASFASFSRAYIQSLCRELI